MWPIIDDLLGVCMKNKLLSFLLVLAGFKSHAGDLKPLFFMPTAKVLPKGIRNFNYNGLSSSANEKFGDDKVNGPLARPLEKNLTFQNIIDGKVDSDEKAAILQVMATTGSNLDDTFGQTTGQVNVEAMAHVPIFAYGLTKNLTVALVVPIIDYSYELDVGVSQTNKELYTEVEKALAAKGVTDKIDEFYEKIDAPVLSKFNDFNYNQPLSESGTKLGDIRIITRYQTLNVENHRVSLQGELVLPTGEDQNINKVVDVASGDDQTDVGLGINYDYIVNDRLTFGFNTTYTVQIKDTNPERIPIQFDSKASPDIDKLTKRNLGDIWATAFVMNYERNGFRFNLGYAYQQKSEDRYSGSAYSSQRYAWLSDETKQFMHSANIIFGYSTVSLFKQKKFPLPLIIAINHSIILAGRNVVSNPLTSMSLSLFF